MLVYPAGGRPTKGQGMSPSPKGDCGPPANMVAERVDLDAGPRCDFARMGNRGRRRAIRLEITGEGPDSGDQIGESPIRLVV